MDISVLVTDNYHVPDADAAFGVYGFASEEAAIEYARRRTRDSVEEMRSPGDAPETVRRAFLMFGESSTVFVGHERRYSGRDEVDFFAAHPATAEERDWSSLRPAQPVR